MISARELTRLREAIKWDSFVFCWINHNESSTLCADPPDAYKIFDIWKTWEYLEAKGIEKRILLWIILSNEWRRVRHRQEMEPKNKIVLIIHDLRKTILNNYRKLQNEIYVSCSVELIVEL